MFGNKVYELSLVKDYVSHWGLAEAARELIQNALDSESPFQFSFEPGDIERNEWTFHLVSEFSRLEPHHLLLGSTSKAQDKSAIGSFGEGFKIALLVLTRLGHPVYIHNNDRTWRPAFRFNKTYGQELLIVEEEKRAQWEPGLSFFVEGLDDADRSTIESCCLKMQPEIGKTIPTTRGDILVDRPGELYVGSLFVTKNDLKFGYNIKPEFIQLERDRQTVSDWDLRCATRDMWYETKRYDDIAQMIFDDVPDLHYARYSAPELVQVAVYEAFKRAHPGALIAESPSEMKKMIDDGLTKTVYVGSGAGSIVKNHKAYKDATSEMTRVQSPNEFLTSWGNAHKSGMDALTRKHWEDVVLPTSSRWKA